MIKRVAGISGITFALVLVWKVALLVFTAQPIPANDSFFYDGAVVNELLHDNYVNPSLVNVLPISANEVYCAYPPLYHLALFGWMKVSGTSALSQMWFHVLLFGMFELVLLGIFRRLKIPAACVNLAGLFLFSITFHDRPDSLAHVLGMAAVYAAICSRRSLDESAVESNRARWTWIAVGLNVLTLCTSLQIGGFYLVLICLLHGLCRARGGEALPKLAIIATWLIPVGLVCAVMFGTPLLWAGFKEHAQLTPTFLGLHVPSGSDILKVIRTVPAILLAAVCIRWVKGQGGVKLSNPFLLVLVAGIASSLAVLAGAMTLLTANLVAIPNYAQPLVVGSFLAIATGGNGEKKLPRPAVACSLALTLLVSVRAIGMTTWGALCSRDVGYASALSEVNKSLDAILPHSKAVVSSAFLYEVAQRENLHWIHSDWPSPPSSTNPDWVRDALVKMKPAALVLTQFDYYRRYEPVIIALRNQPAIAAVTVRNFAKTPAPDSIPSVQKVVQHISWAPVVVELSWKQPALTK
ncbi:MAG: hypothetical protein HOP33_15540 [Verrucomicrobia bacterium]|nr:hypothetical protein [Verrucomicrobiota bacterium]